MVNMRNTHWASWDDPIITTKINRLQPSFSAPRHHTFRVKRTSVSTVAVAEAFQQCGCDRRWYNETSYRRRLVNVGKIYHKWILRAATLCLSWCFFLVVFVPLKNPAKIQQRSVVSFSLKRKIATKILSLRISWDPPIWEVNEPVLRKVVLGPVFRSQDY